jgi:FK506-binding protein 2
MRFSNIATAVALLLTGASALDKPLNIEVLHAVECSTKTKEGK